MAAFKRFSFGDFEIPPLDLPTFSAVPATNDTDQQPVTLRTGSLIDKDAEDGKNPRTHQQEWTSPRELLERGDQYEQSGNYTSQDEAPNYDNDRRQALTKPPKHTSPLAAYSDNYALAPARSSGDLQPLVKNIVPSKAPMVKTETTHFSVTSDGWTYRSISVLPFQTARDIRIAMRDTLGLASDAPLLIYLTTTDRVTTAEISTDEALDRKSVV